MANPNNSGDMDERRKLLDRPDFVHPECMPDVIAGQWLHGDADARRKIEGAISRMPKKSPDPLPARARVFLLQPTEIMFSAEPGSERHV